MPHSQSVEALVLKTYDVGEADRFCVLFTKELGRVAARASGARKLGSRLGGVLLPYRHLRMELRESGASWVITGAVPLSDAPESIPLNSFYALGEGTELLMRLVTDSGELPDAFEVTRAFFAAAITDPSVSLSYTLALCHVLGLLPGEGDPAVPLSTEALDILKACRKGECPTVSPSGNTALLRFRDDVLRMHLQSPLRAGSGSYNLPTISG